MGEILDFDAPSENPFSDCSDDYEQANYFANLYKPAKFDPNEDARIEEVLDLDEKATGYVKKIDDDFAERCKRDIDAQKLFTTSSTTEKVAWYIELCTAFILSKNYFENLKKDKLYSSVDNFFIKHLDDYATNIKSGHWFKKNFEVMLFCLDNFLTIQPIVTNDAGVECVACFNHSCSTGRLFDGCLYNSDVFNRDWSLVAPKSIPDVKISAIHTSKLNFKSKLKKKLTSTKSIFYANKSISSKKERFAKIQGDVDIHIARLNVLGGSSEEIFIEPPMMHTVSFKLSEVQSEAISLWFGQNCAVRADWYHCARHFKAMLIYTIATKLATDFRIIKRLDELEVEDDRQSIIHHDGYLTSIKSISYETMGNIYGEEDHDEVKKIIEEVCNENKLLVDTAMRFAELSEVRSFYKTRRFSMGSK